jgi:LysM repeat protein
MVHRDPQKSRAAAPAMAVAGPIRSMLVGLRWRRIAIVLLVVALIGIPASAWAAPDADTYVVQRGDTLAGIAARSGVTMAALVQANGIRNPDLIYVGQILVVPGDSTSPAPAAAPAATSPETTAGTSEYVVVRGDTLGSIAARFGTTVSALMVANGIANSDRIYVGQKLVVKGSPPKASSGASATTATGPTSGRWIDVDLTAQRLTAYQGKTAVFSTLVSTGIAGLRTPVGQFAIRTKIRAQTMSGPGYYLPNVPYVMYFAGANAIHGTYWHNNFGHPMSHGCVNLPTSAAGWLYNWASIGTPVVTHY